MEVRSFSMFAASSETLIFPVDTSFHQKVRRPGGIPREKALKYAKMQVLRMFVGVSQALGSDGRGMPMAIAAVPRRLARAGHLAITADFRFD
jgi:hypothetical protein